VDFVKITQEQLRTIIAEAVQIALVQSGSNIGAETQEVLNWIDPPEAMKILGVTGSTKMQELRDASPGNGIVFSKHGRIIKYYRPSLLDFLKRHIVR